MTVALQVDEWCGVGEGTERCGVRVAEAHGCLNVCWGWFRRWVELPIHSAQAVGIEQEAHSPFAGLEHETRADQNR